MTVAGVVLAGGAGSRFLGAEHKLRAQLRGRPVVAWVLETIEAAGFDQLYVVSGAEVIDDLVPPTMTVVVNPHWAQGQATSLTAAVGAVEADGHDAFVVGLGDQPLVPVSAWRAVAEAGGEIVTATFDGKRRPPVKLGRSVWAALPTSGDAGARTLMEERSELVLEIPCRGNPIDIDTVEDLRRWS